MKTTRLILLLLVLGLYLPVGTTTLPVTKTHLLFEPDQLSMLTLNTWALPIWYPGSKKQERFENIDRELGKEQYQIICLQETFHKEIRKKLYNDLSMKYYISGDPDCDRSVAGILNLDCNGGLMILSAYPIIEEKFYPFQADESYPYIEKVGAKGILITAIDVISDTIVVMNTHLCSGIDDWCAKIRMKQLQYIKRTVETDPIFKNRRIYFMGDFNIAHPQVCESEVRVKNCEEYDFLTKRMMMDDTMPNLTDGDYSYDYKSNHFAPTSSPRQKLDYIFYKDNTKRFEFTNSHIVFKGAQSLSDHCGLSATLVKRDHRIQNLVVCNDL